jgi:predicted ferric reductase
MAGYTAIASMLIHSLVYIQAWNVSNNLKDLLEEENIMGIVAGLAMLIVFVSTLLLRKSHYEVFYVIHVIMFLLIVIAVAMHRPNVSKKAVWIPIFTGAIWACDRLIRTGRIAWYSYGNAATVTPLAHGGIRIVLDRSASRAVPGSHLFLWMPKIRAMETHPFTISSVNPIELVVAAHDGFTKDLLVYATKYPGASLRASMDGPYGTLPSFILYDQVILIAGGSGASFTFGIAVDLVRRLSPESKTVINFIWIVREQGIFTLYPPLPSSFSPVIITIQSYNS